MPPRLPARADGHRKWQIRLLVHGILPLGLQNPHHTGGQQPGQVQAGLVHRHPQRGGAGDHQRSPARCQPGQSHDSASDVAAGSSSMARRQLPRSGSRACPITSVTVRS